MTAPLSAEDYAHIRADVHTAVLEAQQHDPPVTMEILFRLLDAVGSNAQGPFYERWCVELLEDVHTRATTKVPYEAREYDPWTGSPILRDRWDLDDDERRGY